LSSEQEAVSSDLRSQGLMAARTGVQAGTEPSEPSRTTSGWESCRSQSTGRRSTTWAEI
jgi:hypothetical protein